MARFHIRHEVQEPPNPNGWVLCFQFGTYLYDDRSTEDGYRFIWRRPGGNLMTRGQARIPSIAKAKELMGNASAEGWGEAVPVTAFQVEIVKAIRETFDQLSFSYKAADRRKNSPTYAKNGTRVWGCWREENDPLTGTNGWTQAINTALCRVGSTLGFQTRFRSGKYDPAGEVCPDDGGEFLWDITWLKKKDCQGQIVGSPLVAESELALSLGRILEDFQKLLLANADVRLMVIENFTDKILDAKGEPVEGIGRARWMANHLAQHVQAFNHTKSENACYLLVALDGHFPNEKYSRIRYFRLNTDGTAVEWFKGEPFPSGLGSDKEP